MNVGKSIKHALVKKGMNQTQLAAQMHRTRVWVNQLANSRSASMATVESLAAAFDMKVSDFLALGEE